MPFELTVSIGMFDSREERGQKRFFFFPSLFAIFCLSFLVLGIRMTTMPKIYHTRVS